ncbi:Clustered mitochondria [Venturia nashicola]|uniref:Clustered mitochondria n=1 Tax=Venturia nashicola TaxID=86259 RepID=A0A4Z1P889_9PEZI|nr:Clustered mitochondria [Venturia nashicola]TLD37009.1 Clustered mitochondria [Venturia nashicola]
MRISMAAMAVAAFPLASSEHQEMQKPLGIPSKLSFSHASQTKIIHIIRHGQAYNNLGHFDWLDPNLTDLGLEQVQKLGQEWPKSDSLDLVVSSPQIRALNTTLTWLTGVSKRDITLPNFTEQPIIAFPELQELGSSPSSRGHLREDLEKMLGHPPPFPVYLGRLTPGWNTTTGYWDRGEASSKVRAEVFKLWLAERKERRIAVVGHDANLNLLVNSTCFRDHEGRCQHWHNAEVRHFHFDGKLFHELDA